MDIEALAAFLKRQGLSLRSAELGTVAQLNGTAAEHVIRFTCEPATVEAEPEPASATSTKAPPEPDGLDDYLKLKKGTATP